MVAVSFDVIVIFGKVDFINEPFFEKSKECVEDNEENGAKKPADFVIKLGLSRGVRFVI